MGFSTILDIVGSVFIGGIILLILARLNSSVNENTMDTSRDLTVQQNMTNTVEILQYDFRKIGYCADWKNIPNPSAAILEADTSRISFLTDINRDSVVDKIIYYLGPLSELASTPNPRDRFLYRVVNNNYSHATKFIVTEFYLQYYGVLGDTLSTPVSISGKIARMQVSLKVEDSYSTDPNKLTAYWRQIKLAARNLNNR